MRSLFLHEPAITDEGLKTFDKLTNLTLLELVTTQATEAGFKELHAHIPQCHIGWDTGALRPDKSSSATINDPAFQKWMKQVANLPADKQVEAVAKKLKELNPGFDGKVTPKIDFLDVTELQLPNGQRE